MFEFFYTKKLHGLHRTLSSFAAEKKFQNWMLLSHLLGELWGSEDRIGMVQDFIEYASSIDPDENYIGFDGASIEEKGEYFAISYEWAGDVEFLFPKEKFKQFMDEVEKASEEVYSKSRFESPDRVKFIVDDNWDTRIEQVYLNADTSFFEKDGSGIPQFRFERVKGHQYRLVNNDCVSDQASLVLGAFIEDVWMEPKIFDRSLDFKNAPENGTMYYGKTF